MAMAAVLVRCPWLVAVLLVWGMEAGAIAQTPPPDVPPPSDLTPDLPPESPAEFEVPAPSISIPEILPPPRPEFAEPDLPDAPVPPLPSPEDLLRPAPEAPPPADTDIPDRVFVSGFRVLGSTVFSEADFAEVTQPFEQRDLTFAEVLQVRSAITQLYVNQGYVSSGAFIPPQVLTDGVVTVQVIEGALEQINVTGNRRLQAGYVRSRLALAGATPLNVNRLLEGLQLLQLDPLIESISADLQAGVRPGANVLEVSVVEADPFTSMLLTNNGRSPTVGSFRRQLELNHANLLGLGDAVSLGYSNTDGSNAVDASYTLPLNPRNGTLRVGASFSGSNVITEPFNRLDIQSNAQFYEVSLRQPLSQTPTEEFALGLTGSYQRSQTQFRLPGDDDLLGFPSLGADADGATRVTAVRFFQDWTQRSSRHVLAARSQFSLGLNLLNSTINDEDPDSRFFSWRGQGQWVRVLAPDALLLLRGDVQLADRPLLSQEQFGLGGVRSVRGYRQDALLTDNGAFLSAEVRLPIVRSPRTDSRLQIVPFVDIGTTWGGTRAITTGTNQPSTLAGLGVGLLWQQSDRFSARLDYGIPLVRLERSGNSLQEYGFYFSLEYSPF